MADYAGAPMVAYLWYTRPIFVTGILFSLSLWIFHGATQQETLRGRLMWLSYAAISFIAANFWYWLHGKTIQKMQNLVSYISFFFFTSVILVAKPRTLSKANFNHCPSQEPKWRDDKKGSFSFRCGRKTPENYSSMSRENLCSQVWTENPIHGVV